MTQPRTPAHTPAKPPTKDPIPPTTLAPAQLQRVMAIIIGSAIGDALGAPFEFYGPGLFSDRFPLPVHTGTAEMIGGGGYEWAPGEFTDDTQMALVLAQSLIANGLELEPADLFDRFQTWAETANDVGGTTRAALTQHDHATAAAVAHDLMGGRTGSNGGLMRVAPVAVTGILRGEAWTRETAYNQARVTHFDPIAGFTAAVAAVIMRRTALAGQLPTDLDALVRETGAGLDVPDSVVEQVALVVADGFEPRASGHGSNGGALQCFAEALWAVRSTGSFEDAVRTAVDLGDDADTVAAVAGAMAGALYGQQQLPIRWSTHVHGTVRTDSGDETFISWDLLDLGHDLLGIRRPLRTPVEHPITPGQVHDVGVWAANLSGAEQAPSDMAIVSLCITDRRFAGNPHRREVFIRDDDGKNPHLGSVVCQSVQAIRANLAEGREVLVHCHGGRSRTGLVLKAWYMVHHGVDATTAHDWLYATWEPYQAVYEGWTPEFWNYLEEDFLGDWARYIAAQGENNDTNNNGKEAK